ncbi:MAG: polyisoprenoid-binding protein [Proteobacteria bacterium]|nr:MAG: polyisoprenoid-binding protein [Pseudomonadota bacterium]
MATYQIDPVHSSVGFSVKHMMIAKVRGSFDKFSGTLVYDKSNPQAATAEATIDAASINTNEEKRDGHLRSGDFFDVEKFPSLTFKSKAVSVTSDGLSVTGELSIKGITKQVKLEIEGPSEELKDPYGNAKIGLSATTKISRKEFGLSWNAALETGGVLVGDDITITLDLQFVKQA